MKKINKHQVISEIRRAKARTITNWKRAIPLEVWAGVFAVLIFFGFIIISKKSEYIFLYTFVMLAFSVIITMLYVFRLGQSEKKYLLQAAILLGYKFPSDNKPSAESYKSMRLLDGIEKIRVLHYLEGNSAGRFYFITLIKIENTDKGIESARRIIIGTDLKRAINGWIVIRSDEQGVYFRRSVKKINLESNEFNQEYDVYASEPRLAYQALDPKIMRYLIDSTVHPFIELNGRKAYFLIDPLRTRTPQEDLKDFEQLLSQVESNFRRDNH